MWLQDKRHKDQIGKSMIHIWQMLLLLASGGGEYDTKWLASLGSARNPFCTTELVYVDVFSGNLIYI